VHCCFTYNSEKKCLHTNKIKKQDWLILVLKIAVSIRVLIVNMVIIFHYISMAILVINAIIVILGIIKYSAKTDAPCGGKIY
jgi:hypothetical protein